MISRATALNYLRAGLSVLPAKKIEKCPDLKWKDYQERLPTGDEVMTWFANNHDAICIVCGKVSGNLEVIDFDNHGELFPKWKETIPENLFNKLVVERTPSGGYHVAYRCENDAYANLKLAQGLRDGKLVTLIETRGNGGLVLCSPTEGYEFVQGSYEAVPCLNKKEQETLLLEAWNLGQEEKKNQVSDHEIPQGFTLYQPTCTASEARPGDDFNIRGDIRPLLVAHGWKFLETKPDGNEHWRRPGKEENTTSATLKNGMFYVFTSNAAPFEPNRAYSQFSVYGLLEHNGDFKEAAAVLLEHGYGKAEQSPDVDLSAFLESIQSGGQNTELPTEASAQEQPKMFWTTRELIETFQNMKEPLIDGLLRREEVMNIVAAPKTGKSWLVLQLAIALATGGDWLGRECTKSNVLLVDNELHPETETSRLKHVANVMGVPIDSLEGLDFLLQRGGIKDLLSLESQLRAINDAAKRYEVIIIDALYKALPKDVDENSNGQITGIYNQVEKIAREQEAAVILVHHTSKGNQANKSVTDVGAGAGAQSRAPDTHLALRPTNADNVISVSCCVRSFRPVDPFCIVREPDGLWVMAPQFDPNDLVGKEGAPGHGDKDKMTIEDVVNAVKCNLGELEFPMAKTLLVETVREKTDASRNTIISALDILCRDGIFEIRKGDYASGQQASKLFYPGPSTPYYIPPEKPVEEPVVEAPTSVEECDETMPAYQTTLGTSVATMPSNDREYADSSSADEEPSGVAPATMVAESTPAVTSDADAAKTTRTKSPSRKQPVLKTRTRKGSSQKKLRKTPSKDVPPDSSE